MALTLNCFACEIGARLKPEKAKGPSTNRTFTRKRLGDTLADTQFQIQG